MIRKSAKFDLKLSCQRPFPAGLSHKAALSEEQNERKFTSEIQEPLTASFHSVTENSLKVTDQERWNQHVVEAVWGNPA